MCFYNLMCLFFYYIPNCAQCVKKIVNNSHKTYTYFFLHAIYFIKRDRSIKSFKYGIFSH